MGEEVQDVADRSAIWYVAVSSDRICLSIHSIEHPFFSMGMGHRHRYSEISFRKRSKTLTSTGYQYVFDLPICFENC